MAFFDDQQIDIDAMPKAVKLSSEDRALRDMMQRMIMGPGHQFEAAPVAGMSQFEQQGGDLLSSYIQGNEFRDPRSSPLYQGLRDELRMEEQASAGMLRQQAQKLGVLRGSGAITGEGRLRNEFAAKRGSILGQLYEAEAMRNSPGARLEAAYGFGSLPRQLEQQRLTGGYAAREKTAMFPYQQQFPMAMQLFQESPYYTPQYYTQPSGFQQVAKPFGAMIGAMG